MDLRLGRLIFLAVVATGAKPIAAQDQPGLDSLLPVSGTLTYHAIFYNRAPPGDGGSWGLRLAGRIALRLTPKTYLGVGVGSWSRSSAVRCDLVRDCGSVLVAQSEAVLHQAYAERYVWRRRVFLRAGGGAALTRTLQASGGVIVATDEWRPVLSAGAGVDVRLARFLYLTPSLDGAVLLGADRHSQELRSGIMAGLGVTLR